MTGLIRVLFATVLLAWAFPGGAAAPDTQRGTPIARFLDAQGRLELPEGFSGSLDPKGYRMLTAKGQAPTFVPEVAPAPQTSDSGNWTAFGGIREGCNGNGIYAMAWMANGNLVVGGSFSVCADTLANNIAIYAPSTNTWSSVDSGSSNGVNGPVFALAVSGSDLYVGGNFNQAGGAPANAVARWNGSAWSSLGSGIVNGTVDAIAVSGSDLYVGGNFTHAGGTLANRVARWNGGAWSSLGSGVSGGTVNAMAVSGSDLYVGGSFTQAGGAPANYVARWNGSAWSSLGSDSGNGVNDEVRDLEMSGTNLYVGGDFSEAGGAPANKIARWNGSAWSSLGNVLTAGLSGNVYALEVSGTNLFAGGEFFQAGVSPANNVARWDGSAWSSLGSGAGNGVNYGVRVLAVSGSNLFVGGTFTQAGGLSAGSVARWNGSVWSRLGNGSGNGFVGDILAVAASGSSLYVGGSFIQADGAPADFVARWNGSVWTTLGSGISGNYVSAMAVSGSDLYVGGLFDQAGGAPANNVARWNGSVWSSLGSGSANGVDSAVSALAVSGSDVYVGGGFTNAGGAPANYVARWNGSVWSSLGSGSANGVNGSVSALAVSGSNVYVGGLFLQAGGAPANFVARWNGSAWSSLGSGISDSQGFPTVRALAIIGSDLYVGGAFNRAGGLTTNNIARWNGSAWSSLGSGTGNGVDDDVLDLAVLGGSLYVGGWFLQTGGAPANRIARWDGSGWSSLGSGSGNGMNGSVDALAVNGNKVLVGGRFGSAGGQLSANIAQWAGTFADVSVTLSDAPDPVTAGSNLSYTATLTNQGPDAAEDATISLPLPVGTSFVAATPSAGGSCTASSPVNCTWSGSTSSGAIRSVTIVAAVASGVSGTLSNTATASSSITDPNSANNSTSASTTVIASADLQLTPNTSASQALVNAPVTLTATSANQGPSAAQNVNVSTSLGAPFRYSSHTATGASCTTPPVGSSGTVSCTWSGVTAPGASRVLAVTGSGGVAGTATIQMNTSSATTDPATANNSAQFNVQITAPPPAITSFSAASSTAITSSTIGLSWSASNATSCSPSLGGTTNWSTLGTLPVSGSFNLTAPASPTSLTFQLNCTNGAQSTSASVPVNVVNAPAPAITTFSPTSATVVAGNTITLNWTTSNSTSCSPVLGGNSAWSAQGALATGGSRSFAAPQVVGTTSITFGLNCSNGGQVASSTTEVNVTPSTAPAVNSFFPTQATVAIGAPITLNWSSSNATSCSPSLGSPTTWLSLGSLPATGTQAVNAPLAPTMVTFQLNCTNGVQSTSRTTQVTVQPAVVVPTADLQLARNQVPVCGSGGPTHTFGVSWSSTDAAYCTASETPAGRTSFGTRRCNSDCPDADDRSKLRTALPADPERNYESAYSFITAGPSLLLLTCFNADGTASAVDDETLTTYPGDLFECQSVQSYTPSTTVTAPAPMPDGSVQVQSSVANPLGVPLSASVLEQGQYGTATVEMVGDTVTVRYVADPGRFPEGATATETIQVIVANGGVGVPVTYTFEVDLTLFADGFEGAVEGVR